ncbi:MAG TPA: hypothetical protein PLM41_23295, partial [Saprospiraceae bacterium]|nr:hypothetical protein [Saprospiraceae bacterium]
MSDTTSFSGPIFRRIYFVLLAFCLYGYSYAQSINDLSSLRGRTVDASIPVQVLDSLTIIPPILSVSGSDTAQMLDADLISLKNNRLYIDTARLRALCPACTQIRVTYRVLPYDFAAPVQRLDTAAIRRNMRTDAIEFDYSPYQPASKPWETNGLLSSGAYTRGLSFGNNQNLVF